MISKKKIVAIVLFILMGFVMFTFANPSDGIDSLTNPIDDEPVAPVKEPEKEVIVNPVVPVVVVDNAPVITVEPAIVKIVEGTEYNVLTGVTATDDKDTNLVINSSITSVDKVGEYDVTYTVTDSANHTATATRKIYVLEKDGDEDNDHYTNEEELEAETDFDDEESIPDYDYAPSIEVEGNLTSVVYDKMSEIKESCTDQFYGTKGVTCEVDTTKVDLNNVGTYKVTITATDNLKNVTTKEVDYKVTVRNLAVKITDLSTYYGEQFARLSYTADDNQVSGHLAGIKLTKAEGTDAGTYAITGTWTNKNYNVEFIDGTYTIKKANIAPTFVGKNYTYNYNVQMPKAYVKDINGDNLDLVVTSNGESINVDKYTATASFKEPQKNYNLINNTIEYTIGKKTVTEEDLETLGFKFEDDIVEYDGDNHNLEVTMPKDFKATVSYDKTNLKDAATYDVKATITMNSDNENFTDSISLDAQLIIKAKKITVEWENKTFTYNGTKQMPTAKVKDVDHNEISLTVVSNGASVEVGPYVATASFKEPQKNYMLENTTVDYKISEKDITTELNNIVFDDVTVTYDGKKHTIEASNVPNYVDVKYTSNNKEFTGATEVGVYELTATFTATANYSGEVSKTATLTIEAIPVKQTGILAELKPNVQLEFQKNANINIKNYINVYKVFDNGTKELITDYSVEGFDTKRVVDKKQLVIKSGKYKDTSLKYSIINEEAFQTKFEVLFTGKNGYYETSSNICTNNCDTDRKTNWVSTKYNLLEVVEHYNETIKVKSVVANYSKESLDLTVSNSVRWSRQTLDAKYNPVYIATKKIQEEYEVTVCDGLDLGFVCIGSERKETRTRDKVVNVINPENMINTVDITYTRDFGKDVINTYTITFKYVNNTFKAIDEVKINK